MRSGVLLASFDRFGTSFNKEIVSEKATKEPEKSDQEFNVRY